MGYKDRESKILELLDLNETLTYRQLTESLGISEATVRRDLNRMEGEKLLVRYWGGAKRSPNRPVRMRNILDGVISEELRIIGEIAGDMVVDGELIFIGSGLTTLTMIDYIRATNLTVITNGIPQLEALKRKNINAFLLCGFLKEYSRAVVGPQTVKMLSAYRFDKTFIGVNGLSEDFSLLSADGYEYDVKRVSIGNAKQSFVLAGHGKYHRSAMYAVTPRETVNTMIISDRNMNDNPGWTKIKRGVCLKIS